MIHYPTGLTTSMEKRSEKYILPSVIVAVIAVVLLVVTVLGRRSSLVKVTIPPGLRKEEIAARLTTDLKWTPAEEHAFMVAYTAMGASTSPDFAEGVYFPDTYLIPADESSATTSARLIANFNDKFAPYAADALKQDVKWTVILTLASIIQREAASSSDMALISGILWNRLNDGMPLDVDSTVQYARGFTPTGWWAPITAADLTIVSPYNTYLNKGLPPHPIDNPDLDAIDAALYPASTTCLYYLHDSSKNIHCSDTYAGQQANVKAYLQ